MTVSRRQWLLGAGAAAAVLPLASLLPVRRSPLAMLGAADDAQGRHYVVGLDADSAVCFRTEIPFRAHEVLLHPGGEEALVLARRPGTLALRLDLDDGSVLGGFQTQPGQHLYGHGVFDAAGDFLFTTENDYARGIGLVVVRRADDLKVVESFPSGGIGPHELVWLSDRQTLAVANGGILTHPDRPREKLNLETMAPRLAYLHAASGRCLAAIPSPVAKGSARHMAALANDDVVVGLQYEGHPADVVPLVVVFRANGDVVIPEVPQAAQRRMAQYTASVSVDPQSGLGVVTCPRGHCLTRWDFTVGEFLGAQRMRDIAGVAYRAGEGFLLASGVGKVRRLAGGPAWTEQRLVPAERWRWDNHLTLAG